MIPLSPDVLLAHAAHRPLPSADQGDDEKQDHKTKEEQPSQHEDHYQQRGFFARFSEEDFLSAFADFIGRRLGRDQHGGRNDGRHGRVGLPPLAWVGGRRRRLAGGVRRRHRRRISRRLAPTRIRHASGCHRPRRTRIAPLIIGRGLRPRTDRPVRRGRPRTDRRDGGIGRCPVTGAREGLRRCRRRRTTANLAAPHRLRSRQGCFPRGLGEHARGGRQSAFTAESRRRRGARPDCRSGARRWNRCRASLGQRGRRKAPFLRPASGRTSRRSGRGRRRSQGLFLIRRRGRCAGDRGSRSQS